MWNHPSSVPPVQSSVSSSSSSHSAAEHSEVNSFYTPVQPFVFGPDIFSWAVNNAHAVTIIADLRDREIVKKLYVGLTFLRSGIHTTVDEYREMRPPVDFPRTLGVENTKDGNYFCITAAGYKQGISSREMDHIKMLHPQIEDFVIGIIDAPRSAYCNSCGQKPTVNAIYVRIRTTQHEESIHNNNIDTIDVTSHGVKRMRGNGQTDAGSGNYSMVPASYSQNNANIITKMGRSLLRLWK